MNIRLYSFILVLLSFVITTPLHAVLKEKNLPNTLSILRHELEKAHDELGEQQLRMNRGSEIMRTRLIEAMNRANQNSLMLYSQKQEYVFDLTYACHEATAQYREFHTKTLPFKQWEEKANGEVARYDSLIRSLSTMPVNMLDERAKIDRNVCLTLAVNIRRIYVENSENLRDYRYYYMRTEERLKNLNDYAQRKYNDIQSSIFINGGDNYFTILSNITQHILESKNTFREKYRSNAETHSQWDSGYILFLFIAILLWSIVAIVLNQIIMRLVVTRLMHKGVFNDSLKEKFLAKRACIIMTSTVITFAIILNIIKYAMEQNFVLMASNLLTEYAWLMSVILISILIRVESRQTMHTFLIYSPLLFMGFLVIVFRIVLIPSELVNLFFPPILLICMLWQWFVMRKYRTEVQASDKFYAVITQLVFVSSVVCSWIGYTLLSVQILIWWVMQLTCILSITCISDWYSQYAERHDIEKRPITKIWHFHLFTKIITPIAAIASFIISIYWAADVFNLSGMTWEIFTTKLIDSENFVLSIEGVSVAVALWFVFKYLNDTSKALIRYHFDKVDPENSASRSVAFVNIVQIVILGAWFLITLGIFNVSNEWIIVISGGLSTGIGFASKDILENIYYGVSLMAGRIKIGDLIVCDGTRGRVSSISYTSTMIEAVDGSIIAFQNSQLFTKNYKNLTRNHGYEMSATEVGIAYGTSVDTARKVITEAVSALPCVETEQHSVTVILKELSDSCVTLNVVCWVNVFTAAVDKGVILETIYNTLNRNNIEIPFPQRDIHIISE